MQVDHAAFRDCYDDRTTFSLALGGITSDRLRKCGRLFRTSDRCSTLWCFGPVAPHSRRRSCKELHLTWRAIRQMLALRVNSGIYVGRELDLPKP